MCLALRVIIVLRDSLKLVGFLERKSLIFFPSNEISSCLPNAGLKFLRDFNILSSDIPISLAKSTATECYICYKLPEADRN